MSGVAHHTQKYGSTGGLAGASGFLHSKHDYSIPVSFPPSVPPSFPRPPWRPVAGPSPVEMPPRVPVAPVAPVVPGLAGSGVASIGGRSAFRFVSTEPWPPPARKSHQIKNPRANTVTEPRMTSFGVSFG